MLDTSPTNARSSHPESTVSARPEAVAQRHAEDAVIDQIDALVDESLAAGQQGQPFPMDLRDKCPRCRYEWHGLPDGCCPGPFADVDADEMPNPAGAYVDQVVAATLRYAELTLTEMASGTLIPEQVIGGRILAESSSWCDEPLDEQLTSWNRSFEIPTPGVTFVDDDMARAHRVITACFEMLAEVCGIRLEGNDFEGAIEALEEMTQARREERARRERIRLPSFADLPAPPRGYTFADVQAMREDSYRARRTDHEGQAVQGLQSRGDHEQARLSDDGGWESCARAALCDAQSGQEEGQQDSGA